MPLKKKVIFEMKKCQKMLLLAFDVIVQPPKHTFEITFFPSSISSTRLIILLFPYSQVNPIVDLLNLLRVIGRQDAAQMVEKDFGPWI